MTKSNKTAKRGPSNWMSRMWTKPTRKAVSTATRALTPALMAAVLMSSAMIACGSEAAPESGTEQPAATARALQAPEGNQTDSRQANAPTAERQSSNQRGEPSTNSDTSTGNATKPPMATKKPTPEPSPTATPEPIPTPTIVPTPTPDPKVTMFYLMQNFPTLRDHNNRLIREALAKPLVDFVLQEHPSTAHLPSNALPEIITSTIDQIELERITSDEADLVVKISFVLYIEVDREQFTHSGTATGAVEFIPSKELSELPYYPWGQTQSAIKEAEKIKEFSSQAPIFSHLLSTPEMEPSP